MVLDAVGFEPRGRPHASQNPPAAAWSCAPSRMLSVLCLLTAAGLSALGGLRALGDAPLPPKTHAERLTFDAQTSQWIRTPDPIPGTEDGDLDIARQWLAREDYKTALKVVKAWIKGYGGTAPRYPEALYVEGTARLGLSDYRSAADGYRALLNDFPGSEYAERALSALFRIAEQYMAGERRKAWKGLLRVRDRDAGIGIMDDVIANYADTPYAEQARRTKAEYYYARGEFELAEDEYAAFARDYPRSAWHPQALLKSAESAMASFPGVKFDDAALVEARERFTQFGRAYPGLAQELKVPVLLDQIDAKRADKSLEIARFYDKTGKTNAARYYYRQTVHRWPETPAAAQAQARLAALGEKDQVQPAAGEALRAAAPGGGEP